MKIGSSNKMPMWARFFAVLLGIPLAAALLRTGFEREFPKLTALILAAVALVALYLFLHWQFTSHSAPPPASTEGKTRERRSFDFGLALFLALIFLVGSVMFLAISVFPPADLPSVSRWVIRAASLFIGLLCLLICLSFIFQCRFLVTGKRALTIRLGKSGSHK